MEFMIGGVTALWLLRPPNGNMVRQWGQEIPFWSTVTLIGVRGISILFVGTWFGQYAQSMSGESVDIGVILAQVTILIGVTLTAIG